MNLTQLDDGRWTTVYGRAGDVDLMLDLYRPADRWAGVRPGVVFVHGGGWSGGNRTQFRWHAEQAAAAGYVAISVGYRLTGVARYPAALDDCQRAVRWFRKHAAELNLDPARIGAFGSSAGGHLVACLGVRETRDDSDRDLAGLSSRAQCVVDVHGLHDMPVLASHPISEACVAFIGGTNDETPVAWADASPLRFVDAQSAPTLLVHAPDDASVPYEQSVRFATALMAAARPVEFMPTPGSGHGFVYSPDGEWTKRVWPVALAWLNRFLKPC